MPALKITQLYIYPIKSLGALALPEAHMDIQGLAGDRRYMLVDEHGKFITQRSRPDLTRFQLRAHSDGFLVEDRKTGQTKCLHTSVKLGESMPVELWEDHLEARLVLEDWSPWFSQLLNERVFLVHLTDASPRFIQDKYQTPLSKESSFADALPILLCSEASYEALEIQLGAQVDRLRFRPNIIVSGANAFAEDGWKQIQVGTVQLMGAKPCARCQLITVHPHQGTIQKEVLQALSQIRKIGNKVYFGQQFVPQILGKLVVGDRIRVQVEQDAVY
ncbi:MOSC domain-containing protein [Aquirufa salirivi]|uniref:MOSC N-terminal beta barrel domain-containing protein n=1 Tax=Aquirufa salirivi TaxID=3104729 RepID=A0ABW8RS66_9BACT